MARGISAKNAHEDVGRIEPSTLETIPSVVADQIADLSARSAVLANALHPKTAANLADLVRLMNAYYSNLIEGHNTQPQDIERALADDLADDETRRDLQLEAAAHVRIQAGIDHAGSLGETSEPASLSFLRNLHREFYADVPDRFLRVRGRGETTYRMEPGALRDSAAHDVIVGRHQPPSSPRVLDFMRYFEKRYRLAGVGSAGRIIAMAASHHRFNYIHPFADGNGRVSRLMSHAMGYSAGIAAHGLWSISRGLARGIDSRTEYKFMMDLADTPRENDLDGRGNLSRKQLETFVLWFLRVCVDQVTFMTAQFEFASLSARLRTMVARNPAFKLEMADLLVEAALRGEFERGEASRVTGLSERSARRVLLDATNAGLLASNTEKGPVSLRFPVNVANELFPRLF